MNQRNRKPERLYRAILLPVTAILMTLVLAITAASGVIIVSIENAQTEKSVRQSMNYMHRSLWYQFNSLKSISGYIISSREIERLLDRRYESKPEAIADYYHLFTEFESLSLMSLLNEIDPHSHAQISYVVSVIVGESSGLYELATDRYATVNGLYKYDDVKSEAWFRKLYESGNPMIWWTDAGERGGYIYTAKRKVSSKDGTDLGVVVVAYDLNNIQGIWNQNGPEAGHYVLADERNRVVYSTRYPPGYDLKESPLAQRLAGQRQGLFTLHVDNEKTYVAFNGYDNGWKLISLVPESRLKNYRALIAGVAAAVGVIGIAVAFRAIRRVTAKATDPIIRLAALMKRVEIGEWKAAQAPAARIEEVDLLHRGFVSMIGRLNRLIEEVYVKDIEQKQLKLDLLQSQINPHFLYNTLDMINCKAQDAGERDIGRIVRHLAVVLRYGLNNGQHRIALKDELKQATSYLELQSSMHEGLTYCIEADESLLDTAIVHFVLQPLIENSIVHGFRQKRADRRIRIRAMRIEATGADAGVMSGPGGGLLAIEVADNGCGVDAERMNGLLAEESPAGGTGGFGVRNVDRRIKLHCGERYGVVYIPAVEGTVVQVRLPLEPSDFSPGF